MSSLAHLLIDSVSEITLLLLEALLPSSWSRALLPRVDHFPPHDDRVRFEGFYTRIHTDNGDSLILITSSVPKAHPSGLPFYVHCSYAPGRHHRQQGHHLRSDAFPASMEVTKGEPDVTRSIVPFELNFGGDTGYYRVSDSQQQYRLSFPDGTKVEVDITDNTPLIDDSDWLKTPHGLFARLIHVLPLHWHIFSPQSQAKFKIIRQDDGVVEGRGTAHLEKNWGNSFPSGWTWSQGFTPDRQVSYALAGGRILGNKAIMAVLKTPFFTWTFKPIWAIRALGLSLGFSEEYDNAKGTLTVSVNDARRKVLFEVASDQPLDQWTYLHCPMADGHNNTTAWETFQAGAKITAFERSWLLGAWQATQRFELSSCCLEFGGTYSAIESRKGI